MSAQQQLNDAIEQLAGTYTQTMGDAPLFHPQAQAFENDPSAGGPETLDELLRFTGVARSGRSKHWALLAKTDSYVIFMEDVEMSLTHLGLAGTNLSSRGQVLLAHPDSTEAKVFFGKAIEYLLTLTAIDQVDLASAVKGAGLAMPEAVGA